MGAPAAYADALIEPMHYSIAGRASGVPLAVREIAAGAG